MNLNATIFFQMLVFFVLAWFTMKFVWPPLTKAMDERRQKIAAGLAAAEAGETSLLKAQAHIKKMEAAVKAENHARLLEAEKQVHLLLEQARHDAEAERARIVVQAKQDAELLVQRARDRLREEVADLALKGAEQILRREIDASAHATLLQQLSAQL